MVGRRSLYGSRVSDHDYGLPLRMAKALVVEGQDGDMASCSVGVAEERSKRGEGKTLREIGC